MAADRDGNIGWTVTSAIPRRFGHDGRLPSVWAYGTKGWNGHLSPDEVPFVLNPEGQRLWSANGRMVGGEALTKLGFGGYAHGARGLQIRDALFAREHFAERDMLAIQLDDRGRILERWQQLLCDFLTRRPDKSTDGTPYLGSGELGWSSHPQLGWLSRRADLSVRAPQCCLRCGDREATWGNPGCPATLAPIRQLPTNQADEPVWRLSTSRPDHLVPPGYRNWDAVLGAALSNTLAAIDTEVTAS